MAVTVTRKGQVTIPKRVRDRLGINPGSQVDFELAEDGRAFYAKSVKLGFGRAALNGCVGQQQVPSRRKRSWR